MNYWGRGANRRDLRKNLLIHGRDLNPTSRPGRVCFTFSRRFGIGFTENGGESLQQGSFLSDRLDEKPSQGDDGQCFLLSRFFRGNTTGLPYRSFFDRGGRPLAGGFEVVQANFFKKTN